MPQRRRALLRTIALAGASLFAGYTPVRGEPPPETTSIRLFDGPFLCMVPLYLAEPLLKLEGFTDVHYISGDSGPYETFGDIEFWGAPSLLPYLDKDAPLTVLSGIHAGCWELFAQEDIPSIGALKGKRLAVAKVNAIEHVWLSSIFAYVGIDPRRDVEWIATGSMAASQAAFLEGRVHAFLAFPPQPQDLRLRRSGHVLLDTTVDKPWSNYFCCVVAAHREFARKHPIATRRALRAILRAADICAERPGKAAQFLQDKGIEARYEVSLDVLQRLPYGIWRDWSVEDTLRFHAIRLRDVGMIKSTPNELVERCVDLRPLRALQRELRD